MSAAQKKIFLDLLHTMILVLSVILIVYISVDSINDRNFWENHDYMVFQFWVCVAFIFDFFVALTTKMGVYQTPVVLSIIVDTLSEYYTIDRLACY